MLAADLAPSSLKICKGVRVLGNETREDTQFETHQRAGPAAICGCRTRWRVIEGRARLAWIALGTYSEGLCKTLPAKTDEVKGSGTESVLSVNVIVRAKRKLLACEECL